MWNDPIVEEIRKIREEYAAKFNYDAVEICRDLKRQGEEKGYEYVALPPKSSVSENESMSQVQDEAVRVGQ